MSDLEPSTSLARRVAITLGVPVACFLIARIPTPGLDPGLFEGQSSFAFGVFALGITPAITALTLVELAAVAIPAWRPLRHGGPEARKKLDRAGVIVMLLLALAQAYAIASVARSSGSLELGPMLLAMTTWIAGACFAYLMARVVGRQGIANGFVVLSLLAVLLTSSASTSHEFYGGREVIIAIASLCVLALAVFVALRVFTTGAITPFIPVPASSIVPFYGAVDGLALLSAIALAKPEYAGSVRILQSSGNRALVLCAICAVASVALALQFHRPVRVRALLARIGGAPDLETIGVAIFRALPPTVLLFVCLVFAETTAARVGRSVGWVPLVMAVLFDATDALRVHARERSIERVWEERRPYAIPALLDKLGAEDIPAWSIGLGQQVLLQVFGPYVPVEIWVRKTDAERARKILEPLATESPESASAEKPKKDAALAPVTRRARGGLYAMAIFAMSAIALFAFPTSSRKTSTGTRAALEIVAIDDAVDPFVSVDTVEVPPGVSIREEVVPLSRKESKSSRYLELVPAPTETHAALLERVRPWISKLTLPSDARIVFGESPDRAKRALRSYVLRGAPTATSADIQRAVPVLDREAGQAFVGVELDGKSAERFRTFTREKTGRRIAILVDGRVMSAPVVMGEIGGGKLSITLGAGDLDSQVAEAERLAEALGGS